MKEKFSNFMREINERFYLIIGAITIVLALIDLLILDGSSVDTLCIMSIVFIAVQNIIDEIKNIRFKF